MVLDLLNSWLLLPMVFTTIAYIILDRLLPFYHRKYQKVYPCHLIDSLLTAFVFEGHIATKLISITSITLYMSFVFLPQGAILLRANVRRLWESERAVDARAQCADQLDTLEEKVGWWSRRRSTSPTFV